MGLLTPERLAEARRHNFSGRKSNQATAAQAIVSAVDKVLGNAELARELGDFGRQVVLEEFSLAQMSREVEKVYLKALRRSDNAAN